ncbi:MAG: VirB4-like conjugal transfer ATPase, CD1110 family [Agathobacter rectalis]
MKQKLKRFMAGFMAMLTLVGTLFTNGTTAFAASPQANIAFWNASVKNSGEVSELKPGYNHGKILYSILDGNSAYCMNFGLRADGGQLMNSYDDASTSMSAQQRKLLSYCLYYGFNSTQKAAPSNSQCDEYIATQAMVWVIVADIFGTGSGDSAARKLCNTAPSPDSSYSYYERLRDNISSSYNATLPSFASRRTSEAPTYELKWNEGSQRFETTLSDSNGVLSDFDFGISGYSVDKNGNSITISSTSVNTTATTGTFTSNAGKVETTSSCVFWLTGKSGYQEFISERPTADPIKAYIKVKTENIGYGELTKTDESSGVKLSGAVYGIYSDSGCTNRVQTMTTDGKSIIDRCVRKLYIDIARSKEKYIPVMSDFYDILMAQPEDEAKDIALSLELFVNGSLNIFNHQTNVDVDNRFTVYGIRDLGTELSPITMLVMMESIQNRIVENGKRGKATWLYIDEFHVLLNSEYSAKYLQQLWKKVRKQGGLCTGITQNVVDLLQNYTATTMLANSEFVALLKQANTDSSKMAEVIGVSEAQLRFVTNTASGMGLIKCGSVVIPFDNQISKDTDLYRLYNTNIHEKIAEQKKKEAMLQ